MPRHKSPGEPKLPVTLYLTADTKERTELAAKIAGMSTSGLVERALVEFLARRAKALDVAEAALKTLRASF